MSLQFTSLLQPAYREALEGLLFLHPQQGRFRDTILDAIEAHGVPRVVERDGGLRVEVAGQTSVQTLYVLWAAAHGCELVGAVVYTRNLEEELEIVHIAVKQDYTARGARASEGVTVALVEELCRVACRIRGVRGVRLAYSRQRAVLRASIHLRSQAV
jgi:hypothetical protein